MSFGTPCVVAEAASLPEVVGDAALMAAPGDVAGFANAMSHILSDRELHDDLARSGLARAATFSWELTADATVAVYAEALDRS
jgi:glycosyltransferase involved in cell wall biosynthesis